MTEDARRLRKDVLKLSCQSGEGNLQSIFSCVEILLAVYWQTGCFSRECREEADRDRFLLSKGQATLGLLALLAEKGMVSPEELAGLGGLHSRFSVQADRTKLPILDNSAGSLGHGFPMAAGLAWGYKLQGFRSHVYVLAGDGEMNEGTMWEAAMFAAGEGLDNLTLILDDNRSLQKMLDPGSWKEKLEAFGFQALEVEGHDEEALARALEAPGTGRPRAVLAKTVRGYGCRRTMEDDSWFHRAPAQTELAALLREVEEFRDALEEAGKGGKS